MDYYQKIKFIAEVSKGRYTERYLMNAAQEEVELIYEIFDQRKGLNELSEKVNKIYEGVKEVGENYKKTSEKLKNLQPMGKEKEEELVDMLFEQSIIKALKPKKKR